MDEEEDSMTESERIYDPPPSAVSGREFAHPSDSSPFTAFGRKRKHTKSKMIRPKVRSKNIHNGFSSRTFLVVLQLTEYPFMLGQRLGNCTLKGLWCYDICSSVADFRERAGGVRVKMRVKCEGEPYPCLDEGGIED
jgi:hypothetical protein